ncbi:hypothetical protein HNO88_002681 [Novosphingobium chloroacetimidivorans]|uniref:Uncharacterized protein n=1 Tax=Novosphingobium chloroacetimidivorans TaxID=1428314 RepID=A0A7W7KAP5_9SPHN|nr:hypothetical protein [Novosphingobium chloroacetimidivorans]
MTFGADWRWGADDGEAERIFAFSDEQLCRLNECSAVAPTFPGRLVDRPMTPQTNFRVGERGSPTRVGGTRMKLVRIDDAGRQARTWRGAGLAALRRRS